MEERLSAAGCSNDATEKMPPNNACQKVHIMLPR
jgi:hypothetical protein